MPIYGLCEEIPLLNVAQNWFFFWPHYPNRVPNTYQQFFPQEIFQAGLKTGPWKEQLKCTTVVVQPKLK